MTATDIRVFAAAKINLFLHVGNERVDGFHEVESLVAFADVGDMLAIHPSNGFSIQVEGPFAHALPAGHDNLVLKAARALSSRLERGDGARIVLTKNLPVASGIGGGSADAAAVLRGLVRLWKAQPAAGILHSVAESLGSDVPVCLRSGPSWMEGRGERVTAAPDMPPLSAVLVNPGIAVSTAQIFDALKKRRGVGLHKPSEFGTQEALIGFLSGTGNDLEIPARAAAPVIGDVLDELRHADGLLLARMSGSGATSFGLFASQSAAGAAALGLAKSHPEWWVTATKLVTGPT